MSNIRLSCVLIALAKLDEIFAKCDPDTHYDRARALLDASLVGSTPVQLSTDVLLVTWVKQVRSDLPFCSLDLIEEQIAYRWYLEIICINNDLPF